MKFIDNWRHALGMYSVRCFLLIGSISGAWVVTPKDLIAKMPSWTPTALAFIIFALVALGIFGRLVDQPDVQVASPTPAP